MKKHCSSSQKPRCPTKNAEKQPEWDKNGTFSSVFGGAPWFLPKTAVFLPTPRPIAELHSYVGFFENSSVGPRYIYVSAGFRGTAGPKLGLKIPKKGAKILPPKILTLFSDLKFDVDFDFAINHALTP